MKPSQHLDTSDNSLTILSRESRTPSDLLHRALAHINHGAFDVERLTVYEDPAIAVLNLLPPSMSCNRTSRFKRGIKKLLSYKKDEVLVSVKVTPSDKTKQKFTIQYVMEHDKALWQKKKNKNHQYPASLGRMIEDMFLSIPDISYET